MSLCDRRLDQARAVRGDDHIARQNPLSHAFIIEEMQLGGNFKQGMLHDLAELRQRGGWPRPENDLYLPIDRRGLAPLQHLFQRTIAEIPHLRDLALRLAVCENRARVASE